MNSKWILTGIVLAMLGYQAWRVFDYMKGSLQGVDENTAFWVAVAFLTFTEIGLLVWLHIGLPGSTTTKQEQIANLLVWVDFGGSMILGLADLAKHNTLYAVDLSRLDPILFIAPWVVVAANVGAYIVYKTNDSKEMVERAERRLKHAEHELEIQARQDAIETLQANRQGLARTLAPHYVRDIGDRVSGRTAARFGREAAKLPELLPPGETSRQPGLLERAIENVIGRYFAKQTIKGEKPVEPVKPVASEARLISGNGDGAGEQVNFTNRQ